MMPSDLSGTGRKMYLLKVFNGTQHFLNLCTVLFLNVVII